MVDDPKHSKSTRTFDRSELAELTAASREDPFADLDDVAPESETLAQGSEPTPLPAMGRAHTISDPLTMALLAEVARNSQTSEFEPDRIAEAEKLDVPHPHVKRRG
ncbi:MAG: hypothetical protein SFX73_00165 [Kofleriaceae bacterium]|nr:hypothetical protein [Kofleriaceae bacterium]